MKIYSILFGVFVLINALLVILKNTLAEYDVNLTFVFIANFLLFGITLVAYAIISRKVKSNIHGFMRGVYTSFLVKLFVAASALLIYGMNTDKINSAAVFISLGLYLIYTFIEVTQLMKVVRTHGK